MLRLVLALAAVLALSRAAAPLQATFTIKSASAIPGGTSASIDLSSVTTSAYFYTRFDQSVYIPEPYCPPVSNCAGPSTAPCCVDCVGPSPAVGSPNNAPNCICTLSPYSKCMDATRNNFTAYINRTEYQYYDLGLVNTCRNILVTVTSHTGDANLYINGLDRFTTSGYPGSVQLYFAYDVGSELPGSDAISLCATPGTSGNFKSSYRAYAASAGVPYPHLYISVYGYNEGTYTISVAEAPAAAFTLPVSQYYFFVPTLMAAAALSCQGAAVDAASGLVVPLLGAPDPAFATRAAVAGIRAADFSDNSQVAFLLRLADSTGGAFPRRLVWADPAKCSVDFGFLRDAAGAPLTFAARVAYTPATPACDLTALRLATGEISAASAALSAARSFDELVAGVVRAGTYAVSDDVYGCLNRVGTDFVSLPVATRAANTTQCGRTFGTPEWATDPCCNTALLTTACCVVRTIDVPYVAEPAIQPAALSSCSTPACGEQALDALTSLAAFTSLPPNLVDLRGFTGLAADCQAFTAAQTRVSGFTPKQIGTCEQTFGVQRCVVDADCLSLSCNTSTLLCRPPADDYTALSTCIVRLMSANLRQDLQVRLGIAASASTAQVASAFAAAFNATGCFQPFAYSRAPFTHDVALDASPAACAASDQSAYCNWDARAVFRNRTDCLTSYRGGGGYCALPCDASVAAWCPETPAASYPGCFANYIAAGAAAADCAAAAGQLLPLELDQRTCYLAAQADRASCVPAARCPAGATTCASYCYLPALAQAACDCVLHGTDAYAAACAVGTMVWNTTSGAAGACHLVPASGTPFTSAACLAVNSTAAPAAWWRGGEWFDAVLTNQTACDAAAGYCSDGVSTTAAACAASAFVGCSLPCTGCTADQCNALGTCNAFELSPSGTCVFPAIISPATGLPGCSVNTQTPRSLGCIDGVVNYTQSACVAAGGQWIKRPTTRDECLGYTTCFVNVGTQTSVILFRTQRSAAACASCRGVSLPVFTWVNATYVTPPVWTPYTWRQRAAVPSANQWTRVFDRPAYQAAIDAAFVTRFAQVAATDLSCRFDRSNLYLKAVACDCIDDGAFCYSQLTSEPVGATRFCTGYASSFSQSPVTLSANASATYGTGCINANLGSVGAGRFKQAAVSLYSSLFLKTIVPDPYRFINNSKGHQVAQLLGDGVVVDLSAPAPSGLMLCIELRPEIRRIAKLKVPDFALNADPYPLAAFRPLNLADAAFVRNNASKLLICASVSASGTYFPIARTASWESDTYIDTLDKNKQVIPFLVAGAIYLAIFLFNVYRLVCVFLWTALKKGSEADKGKLLLPKFLLSILTLYLVIRGVYLVLVPVGKMNEAPRVVDLLFAELPTYIYFSLFMLMVFWWIELYNRSTGKSVRTDFLGQMKPLFIAVNVLMYGFFLAVLIVYDHYYTAYAPSALCGVDTTPGQPRVIDLLPKIYKCVVAGIAAIIAIGFIVYGSMLLWTIGGKITVHSGGSRQRLVSLGVIAGVCSAGLIMQAVLLLIGAFSPFSNTRLAIALVMIAELSPAVVLLYFMRQPPLKGHGLLGDLFFCCFEGIDDSSTVGSQSATRSAGASSRTSSGGV